MSDFLKTVWTWFDGLRLREKTLVVFALMVATGFVYNLISPHRELTFSDPSEFSVAEQWSECRHQDDGYQFKRDGVTYTCRFKNDDQWNDWIDQQHEFSNLYNGNG